MEGWVVCVLGVGVEGGDVWDTARGEMASCSDPPHHHRRCTSHKVFSLSVLWIFLDALVPVFSHHLRAVMGVCASGV